MGGRKNREVTDQTLFSSSVGLTRTRKTLDKDWSHHDVTTAMFSTVTEWQKLEKVHDKLTPLVHLYHSKFASSKAPQLLQAVLAFAVANNTSLLQKLIVKR
jgi:hypothetical protein